MGKKLLTHPAQVCFPLAANASNTTIELSTTHADLLDAYRLAMGGSVRVLIASPATIDYTTPYFETVLIDDTHASGVFTVAALTNEAQYTTANGACLFLNLVADGNMEWYGTGAWSKVNFTGFKTTDSKIGVQALRGKATAASGYITKNIKVVNDEQYYFSAWSKVIDGDSSRFFIYDETGAANIIAFESQVNTSWNRVFASFALPVSCVLLSTRFQLNADTDEGWFDNCLLLPNIIANGGFDPSGAELATNGDFATDSNWTKGAGWSIGAGVATCDGSQVAASYLQQNNLPVDRIGKTFLISVDVNSVGAGQYLIFLGGYATSGAYANTTGAIKQTFTVINPSSNTTTYFTANADFIGEIDNFSVKEVEGWLLNNATMELDSSNEKSGTYCAKITASADNGYVYQVATVVDDTWYTFGFNAKGSSAGHRFKFQVIGVTTATTYYDSGYIDSTTYIERLCTIKTNGDTSVYVRGVVETSGEIVYFDDFYGIALLAIPASTETPTIEATHYKDPRW